VYRLWPWFDSNVISMHGSISVGHWYDLIVPSDEWHEAEPTR
jgi:hypothetical protein